MSSDCTVLFLGMLGEFSLRPLSALVAAGIRVAAVVVPAADSTAPVRPAPPASKPAAPSALPVVSGYLSPNMVNLAWERGLPVLEAGNLSHPDAQAALAAYRPDAICVACWPRLIPAMVLALPRLGALNLHPSLLPAYRGPAPLFWQFRNGEARTGVTVHFMNERADAGDILSQAEVSFPDGITGAEADKLCGEAGGRLLVEGIGLLVSGKSARRKQNEAEASYFPAPRRDDFVVATDWPARRAFNFMRGAGGGAWPFTIRAGGEVFRVREALDYSADAVLGAPYRRDGQGLWVQFALGAVRVTAI